MKIPWKSSLASPRPIGGKGGNLTSILHTLATASRDSCPAFALHHQASRVFLVSEDNLFPNKDHLPCLFQATETTVGLKGSGHGELVACWWHRLWSGQEIRLWAKERVPGAEKRQNQAGSANTVLATTLGCWL